MEFLRCNRCYDHFESSSRKFCIIKCGHIFCHICWNKAASKCYECRTVSLNLLPLTKPLKFEMTLNYFSSSTLIIEKTKKAMQFHDEQLTIALRGLRILEEKCDRAKKYSEESIRAGKKEHYLFVKMVNRVTEFQYLVQAHRAQSTGKMRYAPSLSNTHVQFPETPRRTDDSSSSESWQSGTYRNNNITSVDRVESNVQQRRNFEVPRSTGSKRRLHPGSFTTNSYNTEKPKNIHEDGFVVPTITKVPKSVTASGKNVSAKKFPRLSEPRFEQNSYLRAINKRD